MPPPVPSLRDARDEDREAIRQLTLDAYAEYATRMPERWENYRRGILATLADVRPAEQIVAEVGGTIVGTVLLYPAGTVLSPHGRVSVTLPCPEVRLLAVSPAERGRGVGAALIGECIARARRAGAGAVTLHTTDVMVAAMRLYERLGFARAPELDFRPVPDFVVKGYRLRLDGMPGPAQR